MNNAINKAFDSQRVLKISKTKFFYKISTEIEVGESYFLQCLASNCVVEGAKRMRGCGAGRKRFYFVLRVL
ncbi:hypothetical protein [Campylobacter troglodytis]|uniref:hypothetical protein n=1 Tax=Campylobacter troglodytis TaxID=654363 RepID=UPI00115AFDFF|nr:hypothetical protein [Campylobacter troglodytis]TQR58147.1 hypothetical protein DMC01_08170 [Campylobacter troglodytis]